MWRGWLLGGSAKNKYERDQKMNKFLGGLNLNHLSNPEIKHAVLEQIALLSDAIMHRLVQKKRKYGAVGCKLVQSCY